MRVCPILACLPDNVKEHITGKYIAKRGQHTGLPLQNTGSFSHNRSSRKILLNLKRYGLIYPFVISKSDVIFKSQKIG